VAPKDVPVHRQEVYDAIHAQKSKLAGEAAPIIAKPADTPPERV